jgi:hypothetical protein
MTTADRRTLPRSPAAHGGQEAESDRGTAQNPSPPESSVSEFLSRPPLDDFWAHQIAEKAKGKVLGYFAIATILVAFLSFLYGKETIDHAVQAEVKSAVSAKSSQIDKQIDELMKPDRDKIARLEAKVTELNSMIDQYQKDTENRVSVFTTLIAGSTSQVTNLLSSIQKHKKPIPEVVQSTIDLSNTIGMISSSSTTSNVGEAYPPLYAISSILSATGQHLDLSVEGVFYGAGGSDAGITTVQLMQYLKISGAYRASDWPRGTKTKPRSAKPVIRITGYSKAKGTDLAAIKYQLGAGDVIIAEMNIDSPFFEYKSGIFDYVKGKALGAHILAIVGYDNLNNSLKLANTWGTDWGEGGFIRMSTKAFLARVGDIYWISGVQQL